MIKEYNSMAGPYTPPEERKFEVIYSEGGSAGHQTFIFSSIWASYIYELLQRLEARDIHRDSARP
jgi:hypothetical protein